MIANNPHDPRIGRALNLIANESWRCWSVTELAEQVQLSPGRFRRLFALQVGKRPIEYLRDQRLLIAEQLLSSSSLKVNEVMRRVGYSDPSHFSRDFKAKFHCRPSERRRSQRS